MNIYPHFIQHLNAMWLQIITGDLIVIYDIALL